MKLGFGKLSFKIVIIVLAILIVSTSVVGALGYVLNRSAAVDLSAEKALAIADTLVAAVDPKEFEEAIASGEKNEFWFTYKEILDDTFRTNDIEYLYVIEENYDDEVTYFAEGYGEDSGEPEVDLGVKEPSEDYADEMFESIDTGTRIKTDFYKTPGYPSLVSGFSPILDENGGVLGVVGVDLSVDEVLKSSTQFGLTIIAIVLGLSVLMGILIALYIRRTIGKPIRLVTEAASRIAEGDTDFSIDFQSKDEIGKLVETFNHMANSAQEQANVLDALANGDLTVSVTSRGAKDVMSHSMLTMISKLNSMFVQINGSTAHVSSGASQIADGSQTLASSSSQQAAAVEEFSAALNDVKTKTQDNAANAKKSLEITRQAGALMGESTAYMNNMLSSMRSIDESSQSINRIIKVIEDIAFQTNILALNAAVEAARAGQHGKGFAVVADEVRNLASKSAAAAKETSDLILSSSEKVREGNEIVEKTNQSLALVGESAAKNLAVIQEIADSSEEQARAIAEITIGIEQISHAVQANSAVSQESAAASQEMNGQVRVLQNLISQFKIR